MVLGRFDLPFAPQSLPQAGLHRIFPGSERQLRDYPKLARDVADYALFLPCIWIVCALGHYLRLGGSLIVVAIVAFGFGYAVLRSASPPKWLTAYVVICVIAAILSHYRVFPSSWQTYFRDDAIVRQLAPVIAFFTSAWAAKAYFERRLLSGDAFSGGGLFIFLGLVVAPIVLFLNDFQYEGQPAGISALIMYGSFTNNISIAMLFITAGIVAGSGWRRYMCMIIVLMMLIATSLIQFLVVSAGILAILVGAPGRAVATGIILSLLTLYLIGLSFIPEMMIVAPNSGIRLAFIMDSFKSTLDTYGLGIGYGTESVRSRYYFPNLPEVTLLPDPDTITSDKALEVLSTGVHNSFIQALLRTGILGFVVFSVAFLLAFPSHRLPRKLRNHAAILFVIMFVACFVNPALESPAQSIGVGVLYGYLIVLRAYARFQAPSSRHMT